MLLTQTGMGRHDGRADSETMNDEQAKWIGDGLEMVVGVLGMLEQEHSKHQITTQLKNCLQL